jgi:hypothetical protein
MPLVVGDDDKAPDSLVELPAALLEADVVGDDFAPRVGGPKGLAPLDLEHLTGSKPGRVFHNVP